MATIQNRKITSTDCLLEGFAVLVIIIFCCVCCDQAGHTAAKTYQLILHPSEFPESGMEYLLLHKVEEFSDADAAPIYEKAVQSLPDIKEKVNLMMKRLDRHIAVLQCIEAIRDYAATHDGQLPRALSDINQMEIPNDVMSGKAFEYSCTATSATLKSVIPESGDKKDAVDYVITLKK